MNILFPTISTAIRDISNRGIYPDLVRELADKGHRKFVVYPLGKKDEVKYEVVDNITLLGVPFF
jgi:hypothetical protein